MTRLAISGATGRMGRALIQAITDSPDATLVAALARPDSSSIGVDAGSLAGISGLGVSVTANAGRLDDVDVLIDFTLPEPSLEYARACALQGIALVTGTTGYSPEQLAELRELSGQIAICHAANFSTGVNLCLSLLEQAARVLQADSDIEIIEAHHRHKVDAPSGTALAMGETIARATGRSLEQDAIYGREGITGARERRTIGFSTIRGGDIVGDHTVLFAADGERVEITHKASSRLAFARGALRAARWLHSQKAGLYSMRDVLDL